VNGLLSPGFDVNEFAKFVAALFAIMNPIGVAPLIVLLTPDATSRQRAGVAVIAAVTVLTTLLVADWYGREFLRFFAISVDAFRVAGGLLILLTALDMMRPGAGIAPSEDAGAANPGIVPIGIPLLAGPGAIATVILYANHSHPAWIGFTTHIAAITLATLIALFFLIAAVPLQRIIGRSGLRVVSQIMGLVLAAIAIEMIVHGIGDHLGQLGMGGE
jgi:multiple antibiotic resistance protein